LLCFVLGLVVAGGASASLPEIQIDPGLKPRLTSSAAAQIAHDRLGPNIRELHCTTSDRIVEIRGPDGQLNRNVVWLAVGSDAWIMIDDASGRIVGAGGSGGSTRGGPGPERVQP
jgi:hypothetical protein